MDEAFGMRWGGVQICEWPMLHLSQTLTTIKLKLKLHGLRPRVNYTDRATVV
jgi:hypothetical protein